MSRWRRRAGGADGGAAGFFNVDSRLAALSRAGDPLVRLASVVDFAAFRAELGDGSAALGSGERWPGQPTIRGRCSGSPAPSPDGAAFGDGTVTLLRLVLQTLYTLSDEQAEYQLRDRLSFMRFAGLGLGDPVPDAKTLWLFREQLTRAGAIERLFARFDRLLRDAGWADRRCHRGRGQAA